MENYRELGRKLNACVRKQMGKALFGFFVLSMLETFILSFFMTPVLLVSKNGKASVFDMIATAVSLYAGFIVILVLQYGYHVLIVRLVRGDYATVGYLFEGFRSRRRIFPAAVLYAIGLTAALVVCQIAAFFLDKRLSAFSDAFGLPLLLLCVVSVFVVLSLAILVKFSFVWLCLYDNPALKVPAAFGKSVRLLRHRAFRLIGFVLYAGGRHLIVAVAMFAASMIVPASTGAALSLLAFVLEFVYFVAAYSAVVRMFMAIPVFYDSIVIRPTDAGKLQMPSVAELPGPDSGAE